MGNNKNDVGNNNVYFCTGKNNNKLGSDVLGCEQ